MSQDLTELVVKLSVENAKYSQQLQDATAKLQRFSKETNSAITDIAKGFVALFAFDKITEFIGHQLEAIASLNNLSQASGVSVEQLSRLQFAFGQGGVDADGFSVILKKLNQNISDAAGNAQGPAASAFRALGISLKDVKDSSPDQVISLIADKFAAAADGPNKVALALALLGKEGVAAIPTLNAGADALKKFGDQADAIGATVSGSTAKAADEFNNKLGALKITLVDGLAKRVAADLLPTLTKLGDSFGTTAEQSAAFAHAADVISFGLKSLFTFADNVITQFDKLGTSFGAIAATVKTLFTDGLSAAAKVYEEGRNDIIAKEAAYQKRYAAVWAEGTKPVVAAAEATAAGVKGALGNLQDQIKTDAAVQKLSDFADSIKETALSFGLGGEALTKFKLQFGPLGEAVRQAGAEGKKFADEAVAYSRLLQTKVDTKATTDFTNGLRDQVTALQGGSQAALAYKITTGDLGAAFDRMGEKGALARAEVLKLGAALQESKNNDAAANIDISIQQLTGHLTEAAAAAFDLANKQQLIEFNSAGRTADVAKLENLRKLTVAQAAFNEQSDKASDINAQLQIDEQRIADNQQIHAITELQALEELDAARTKQLEKLREIAAEQSRIAADSGSDKLKLEAAQANAAVEALEKQTGLLSKKVRGDLEDSFSEAFTGLITGSATAGEALKSFFSSIEQEIASLVAKDFAKRLFGTLLGSTDSSSGGGIFGAIAGLFGSPKAAGGPVDSGRAYLVGENGPEMFVPGASGKIVPNGSVSGMRGGDTNITLMVHSDNGYVPRQTQQQLAASAARAVTTANRRNN